MVRCLINIMNLSKILVELDKDKDKKSIGEEMIAVVDDIDGYFRMKGE